MFLQYAPLGAVVPLLTLHLQGLGFTPVEIGWISATQALGTLIANLFTGQLADRWWPAERCLAVCAVLAGLAYIGLATITNAALFLAVYLIFWLVMGPVLVFGTAVSFTHVENPERNFGHVRLWGTVGWMTATWLLSFWLAQPGGHLAHAFPIGAGLSFVLALYALTLPHTPPLARKGPFVPLAALSLLRNRTFAVCCLCSLGMCITMPFSIQTTPLLFKHMGIPIEWVARSQSSPQVLEVVGLATLPMATRWLGLRRVMALGMAGWVVALTMLAVGRPLGLLVVTFSLYGLYISWFLVSCQVLANSRARSGLRTSAQGLLQLLCSLGLLVGNVLTGWVREAFDGDFPPTFAVAALIGLVTLGIFSVALRREQKAAPVLSVGEQSAA